MGVNNMDQNIVLVEISIGIFWLLCGVLSYGLFFAILQKMSSRLAKTDYRRDQVCCIFFSWLWTYCIVGICYSNID